MEIEASFMENIEELRIQPNQQDRWIWKGDVSGLYSVGSGYHLLNEVVRMRTKMGHSHSSGK